MKNIAQLMQKAQQVQTQMNIVQNKLEKQEFVGESGNGAVKITMTGKGYPVKVAIESSVVDKGDIETLEDLVLIALKDQPMWISNCQYGPQCKNFEYVPILSWAIPYPKLEKKARIYLNKI